MTAVKRGCGKFLLDFRKRKLLSINKKQIGDLVTPYLSPEEIESNSFLDISSNTAENSTSVFSKIFYAIRTALSFFPAIGQMMYLVYLRRMHRKPDWYITSK
jgi:hypothetical protein